HRRRWLGRTGERRSGVRTVLYTPTRWSGWDWRPAAGRRFRHAWFYSFLAATFGARTRHGCGDGLFFLRLFRAITTPVAAAALVAVLAFLPRLKMFARAGRAFGVLRCLWWPVRLAGAGVGWRHVDAIHRAHRYAQLTARALVGDHGMHLFRGADDGVHRAGLDAARTADALGFTNECHLRRPGRAAFRGDRPGCGCGQLCQLLY